jgi:hypothetical protein
MTKTSNASPDDGPTFEFPWRDVVVALFRARGIKTGLWQFGVRLRFAALNTVHPDSNEAMPAGLVGLQGISIRPATAPGPLVFDAASGDEVRDILAAQPAARPTKAGRVRRRRPESKT